jgi:hypothetical protein
MTAKAQPVADERKLWKTRCWVKGEKVYWIGLVEGDEA